MAERGCIEVLSNEIVPVKHKAHPGSEGRGPEIYLLRHLDACPGWWQGGKRGGGGGVQRGLNIDLAHICLWPCCGRISKDWSDLPIMASTDMDCKSYQGRGGGAGLERNLLSHRHSEVFNRGHKQ